LTNYFFSVNIISTLYVVNDSFNVVLPLWLWFCLLNSSFNIIAFVEESILPRKYSYNALSHKDVLNTYCLETIIIGITGYDV